ncbi:uncharacterized protein LOC128547352 [Mercenaria mercenaria]|uniref:uncharacterized protein LOC128547352 n=1 Tax=Mercenaria mercenaria TaxID=6596 RepID=UPI00234F2337|nr:uncharacterized protein LOC128547352 [Mercenaria mercenaria]XP_053375828.1 uncharacterized protein LOC128547352 [Mercenaria mercenaria]
MSEAQVNIETQLSSPVEEEPVDFTTKTWREDFCFIVENKKLFVARNVLALASPVFERMFQGEFKEKGEAKMALPGKKFEDVKEFLQCIYPSVLKDVTIKNAHKIVALAEEYQVAALKSKCEACFLTSLSTKTSAKDIYRLIDLACLYSLDDLFQKCTTLAAEKALEDLDEAEIQTPIPSAAKLVIQREIIDKMKANQIITSQVVDSLNEELQRTVTLNNYHRADLPKGDQLSLDDYKGWSGTSLFLNIGANKNTQVYMPEVCGIQIAVEFKFATRGTLVITLHAQNMKTSVLEIFGKVVFVNGIKGKTNMCQPIQTQLYDGPCRVVIKHGDILQKETEGYIYHGKMDVEIHLFALKKDSGYVC